MKKKNKLIDLHFKWMETGLIEYDTGLCNSVPDEYYDTLNLFRPNKREIYHLEIGEYSIGYWASGLKHYDIGRYRKYTELRQIIVLFICAMHDEI